MLKLDAMLDREIKLASADLSHVDETGRFSGYASLFGVSDTGKDVVDRGAFAKTLSGRPPSDVRMLFQHDPSDVIGTWTALEETDHGLRVEGQLCLDVARAREIYALMRSEALDGLSIGFRTIKGRKDPQTGIRHLIEVELHEISVVTFPMLPQARVTTLKAAGAALPSLRTFERWLSRDAGFSRKQAQTIIRSGYHTLISERDAALMNEDSDETLAASMRQASIALYQAARSGKA